jgi:hypothetical protein
MKHTRGSWRPVKRCVRSDSESVLQDRLSSAAGQAEYQDGPPPPSDLSVPLVRSPPLDQFTAARPGSHFTPGPPTRCGLSGQVVSRALRRSFMSRNRCSGSVGLASNLARRK